MLYVKYLIWCVRKMMSSFLYLISAFLKSQPFRSGLLLEGYEHLFRELCVKRCFGRNPTTKMCISTSGSFWFLVRTSSMAATMAHCDAGGPTLPGPTDGTRPSGPQGYMHASRIFRCLPNHFKPTLSVMRKLLWEPCKPWWIYMIWKAILLMHLCYVFCKFKPSHTLHVPWHRLSIHL